MPSALLRASTLAGLWLAAAAPCEAATILASFTGQVTSVDAALSASFQSGDAISGSFSFDSDAMDASPADLTFGEYQVSDLSIQVGTYSPDVDAGDTLEIGNHSADFLNLIANPSGSSVGAFSPNFWQLNLADSTGSVFDSDALPTSLSLDDFDSGIIVFEFFDGMSFPQVTGTVTSISLPVVPEPASALLVLAGLVALGLARASQSD
jgi:hypothetical protein